MSDKTKNTKSEPAPKPSGFDRGPQDFFRGPQTFNFKNKKINNRSFIGMRRGSK
jgi:hypothetical protein